MIDDVTVNTDVRQVLGRRDDVTHVIDSVSGVAGVVAVEVQGWRERCVV